MSKCSRKDEDDNIESTFLNFSKNLVKTFILITVVMLSLSIKNKLIKEEVTLFYIAIFLLAITILFTIIGIVDTYLYNNLIIGIGIALGLQIMNFNNISNA